MCLKCPDVLSRRRRISIWLLTPSYYLLTEFSRIFPCPRSTVTSYTDLISTTIKFCAVGQRYLTLILELNYYDG